MRRLRCAPALIRAPQRVAGSALRPVLRSTRAFSATAPSPISFIEKTKREGSQSLLGPFTFTAGFDSCLKDMKVLSVTKTEVKCSLPVNQNVQNSYGTLHGAAITALIDVVGTMALMAADHTRGGVSVDMNVNFLNPAKLGETVTVTGRLLKTGKSLGFTQVDVHRDSDGKLVATGRHTKFL